MNKSFLLFPFIALGLTACNMGSSETSTAEITSVNAPSWQSPEVQSVPMPSTMTQPSPSYQPPQMAQNVPQAITASASQPTYGASESVGNCQVVRDGANSPIYAQIQKGCYHEATYTVGKHDTVFLIAYLSGKSVADIASLNQLTAPYSLKMGQVLRLK